MFEIDNYILVFQCIVKMGETFWPMIAIAFMWALGTWLSRELRHQDKSRMQTKP
jgi:hypothetical protein